jgi:NTP pyrophosphatase (non-canonical NTP hydrolase)
MKLTRDELLVLLIEECGEVIQAATKCLRFGFDVDQMVGYGNNRTVLSKEVGDLLGVVDALPLSTEAMEDARATKIDRAERAKEKFGIPESARSILAQRERERG